MIPKIIHQFWDRPEPPTDVRERMATWRAKHPDWDYRHWHDDTAEAFILAEFGNEAARCFRASTVPAMRSDILRVAAVLKFGGVYIDADMACIKSVAKLRDTDCLLYERSKGDLPWILYNAFIMAVPGHRVIRRMWDQIILNVSNEVSHNVSVLTGPRMWGQVWQTVLTDDERASVQIIEKRIAFKYIGKGAGVTYKEGGSWKAQMRGGKATDFSKA